MTYCYYLAISLLPLCCVIITTGYKSSKYLNDTLNHSNDIKSILRSLQNHRDISNTFINDNDF